MNGEGRPGSIPLRDALCVGTHRLDAIEKALRIVEDDESVRSVGRGGMPNICGVMQCDASLLDGATLQCGAVGALENFPNAISVARKIIEKLPHVFLVGEGAARFAKECGFETAEMLTDDAKNKWIEWLAEHPAQGDPRNSETPLADMVGGSIDAATPKDTVIALVQDDSAEIASGASTSGWDFKYPGRLGDSPMIGAGHYCDSRFGAAACTHTGEMTIRLCAAHAIVMNMKVGMSPRDACIDVQDELYRLKEGHVGEVMLYAVNPAGEHAVISTGPTERYYFWNGSGEVQRLEPLVRRSVAAR